MGIFQNNEKSPCKINIYVAPPLFPCPLSGPTTFFILESSLFLQPLPLHIDFLKIAWMVPQTNFLQSTV